MRLKSNLKIWNISRLFKTEPTNELKTKILKFVTALTHLKPLNFKTQNTIPKNIPTRPYL